MRYQYGLFNWLVAAMVGVGIVAWTPASADGASEAIGQRIEQLQSGGALSIAGAPIAARDLLPELYAARQFRPLWTNADRIRELLELIERAPEHGLLSRDYFPDQLQSLLAERNRTASAAVTADLDILLTESFARYGFHRTFGKVTPSTFDANINFRRAFIGGADPAEALQEAIESPVPLDRQLDEALRPDPVYRAVQDALLDYRAIQANGGWPTLPPGPTLRKGDVDPRVAILRRRLQITGDLPAASARDDETFDEALHAAVVAFQARHLLDADGVVGPRSVDALNVRVEDRIDQLRLTLERLRWLQLEDTEDAVVVNIAHFKLFAIHDGKVVLTARTMVGTEYRQTPVFRGDLRYMELNPTWTVPPTILRKDTLPAIKRDVDYLAQKNMVVLDRGGRVVDPTTVDWQSYGSTVPYTIRQEPGPNNALGRIKFIFPNPHFVFLHDTPSRGLFDRTERTFSSGCIRVENPLELAALLAKLDGQTDWTGEALAAAVDGKRTQRIHLSTPVPVLIAYLTASTAPGQPLFFGRDIYDRDRRLLPLLDGPVAISRPTAGS